MKHIIDKIALIDVKEKKVLMTLSKGKERWFNPGGKRKEGETDEQALVREIKEELSVDLDPRSLHYYGTFEAQAWGKPEGTFVRMRCYTGSYSGTPRASGEIQAIAYFSYNQKRRTTPVDFLIFDDLKSKGLIG